MLAAALLCAALGAALGTTSARLRMWGLLTLAVAALTTYSVLRDQIGSGWADALFLACWLGIVGTAASVYLRQPLGIFPALLLSLHAGMLSGALAAVTPTDSLTGMLAALSACCALWPFGWAARRQLTLPAKVVSSWLMAIAVLAAVLQFLPLTPGYLPDHVE